MINQNEPMRERLLQAALKLFSEKGYGSTSVADILREAGANSGSLYYAFPTKQDLLVAVLRRYREGIRPMLLEPAWRGVADPVERVFALLAAYRDYLIDTDCLYGCPIGSVALELHEPDPVVREELAGNFAAWKGAVAECFRDAGDRLGSGVDPAELAAFTLSVMEGGVMQARTERDPSPFDASVRRLRDYVDRLQEAARSHGVASASSEAPPSPVEKGVAS